MSESEEAQKARFEEREIWRSRFLQDALEWRGIHQGIDRPCPKCGGAGTILYGSTTTWHGGIGGQAMALDICDKCWGSGDEAWTGTDGKKALSQVRTLERRIQDLKTVLQEILDAVDEGDCRLDHHGFCQSHFLDDTTKSPGCRVARAKKLLEEKP